MGIDTNDDQGFESLLEMGLESDWEVLEETKWSKMVKDTFGTLRSYLKRLATGDLPGVEKAEGRRIDQLETGNGRQKLIDAYARLLKSVELRRKSRRGTARSYGMAASMLRRLITRARARDSSS